MTFDEIIEMLRQNRVHLITNRERAALSMINDSTEEVTLTRAEYEYAVKHNCSYEELLSFRKVVSLLKGFKVKVDVWQNRVYYNGRHRFSVDGRRRGARMLNNNKNCLFVGDAVHRHCHDWRLYMYVP